MIRTGGIASSVQIMEGYRAFRQEASAGRVRLAALETAALHNKSSVDISWLPLAAEQYMISADINDYVICDIPIVHVNVPNRNLDAFPFEEVTRFDPQSGRPVYQTFVGKPTHANHDNKVHARAKGVIFDASLVKEPNGYYTIRILAGFDRTKDRQLATEILSGRRPGHSMGCFAGETRCSICGASSTTGRIHCAHMEGSAGKGRIIGGKLTFERCYAVNFFESSSVDDPADYLAISHWSR